MIPCITQLKFKDLNILDWILIMPNLTFEYHIKNTVLLGPYEKLWKVAVLPYLSVWNNSAPTRWVFMKFDIWVFFENLFGKFKFQNIWQE